MGFFDLFSGAKDNMDKSRQAREYIQRAKELVREGEEIYDRAYDKVTSYASETQYRLRQHMDYKKGIAKELGSGIGATLRDFKNFNVDSRIMATPSIQEPGAGLSGFGSTISSGMHNIQPTALSIMPRMDVPSIFDMFTSDVDYYEAKRQRDEARYYKERMRQERDKLNDYKEKMREIRTFIDSEKRELDSLVSKLKKMTGELKTGMQKSGFSMEEAEYLKAIHEIAESIIVLLSTEFLSDGFSINQRYQKAFADVKSINQNLPYAPSISDVNTVNTIKRILDGTIVH